MGFEPCKNEPDIWMRKNKELNVWEHVAVHADDLAFVMKKPQDFVDILRNKCKCKLKGTGHIEFHLGCDFFRDQDGVLCMAPKKHITRMVESCMQHVDNNDCPSVHPNGINASQLSDHAKLQDPQRKSSQKKQH